jgi:hypothetical protein
MNDYRSDTYNDNTNIGEKLKPFNKDSLKFRILKAPLRLGIEENFTTTLLYQLITAPKWDLYVVMDR